MTVLIKKNIVLICLSIFVLLCGTALMLVSQEVYQTQKHVSALEREKQMTEWEIRALNGEIAFLTRPDRMDKLSAVTAQSLEPASGHSLVVSPVHFSVKDHMAILPRRKPAASSHVSVQNLSPSPLIQQTKEQNFSTLLDIIGGNE